MNPPEALIAPAGRSSAATNARLHFSHRNRVFLLIFRKVYFWKHDAHMEKTSQAREPDRGAVRAQREPPVTLQKWTLLVGQEWAGFAVSK